MPDCASVAAAAITPEAGPDMMVLAASRATTRRRHRAAVAVHDQQVALEALRASSSPCRRPHVAVEDRLHGGVHGRGGAALVLAELRQQRVPERDVGVGPERARDLAGAQLVRRVGVGMQEMDDEALAARRQGALRRLCSTSASSSGVTTSPATFMRSSTSRRSSRGISGSKVPVMP